MSESPVQANVQHWGGAIRRPFLVLVLVFIGYLLTAFAIKAGSVLVISPTYFLDLPVQPPWGGLLFMVANALYEEAEKLLLVVLAALWLRLNPFSALMLGALTTAVTERLLYLLQHPYPPITDIAFLSTLALDVRALLGHTALTLVIAFTVRLFGLRVWSVALGLALATAFHAANNLLPRMAFRGDADMHAAFSLTTGALFFAVVALAIAKRQWLEAPFLRQTEQAPAAA